MCGRRRLPRARADQGFRGKPIVRPWVPRFQARAHRRPDPKHHTGGARPAYSARHIDPAVSHRDPAIPRGGTGAPHLLVRQPGRAAAIDRHLYGLPGHRPAHESDHVLHIADNALCGGTRPGDIGRRRTDEAPLDAPGADRVPDPTTAGGFRRRVGRADVTALHGAIAAVRRRVWAEQPDAFRDRATLDMDGARVETTGACTAGMGIAYDGTWGYHPPAVSRAEAGEVLGLANRSGNRPSHDGAAPEADRAPWLGLRAHYRRVVPPGATDFSQTEPLDRWDARPGVGYVFGYGTRPRGRDRRAVAGGGLAAVAVAGPVPREGPAPSAARSRQGPGRPPAAVRRPAVASGRGGRVRLSADALPEGLPPGRGPQAHLAGDGRGRAVPGGGPRPLHHPRPGVVAGRGGVRGQRPVRPGGPAGAAARRRALPAPVNAPGSNWTRMGMSGPAGTLTAWWALMLPE